MRKRINSLEKLKTKKSLNSKLFNDNYKSSNLTSNSTDKNLSTKLNLAEENVSYYLDRIDDYTGFFTTQQINNIDFSKFENHVFFDSAVDKINYSFKKILNEFPYDSTELEFDQFIKNLDGYTSYLLKKVLPKNIGYINLNGSYKVEIKDKSGSVFNNPVNDKKGLGYLDPKLNSFTFDFWLRPRNNRDNQVIFQKLNEQFGYTVYLKNYDASDGTIELHSVYKTDSGYITSFCKLVYESWNHININITKTRNKRSFTFYVNGVEQKDNTQGNISISQTNQGFKIASLFIGHGSAHSGFVDEPTSFIGFIDNFRVFNRKLSKEEIIEFKENDIYSTSFCVLNLTFNEPPGEYTNNNIVLDSSGKKLDGVIKTLTGENVSYLIVNRDQLRVSKLDSDYQIRYEKIDNYPVRFPSYQKNIDTQIELINKGKRYDKINPNVFYKLFPKNLFLMSSEFENKEEIYVDNSYYRENENSTKIITPESSGMIQILSIWSRFFDQLKMYIDAFDEMINLDYDSINKNDVLGMFLPSIVKKMGFEFKELLPASLKTKLDNKHLTHEEIYSDVSIRHVQNELWKRFLINSQDFLRSKGTKKSINTLFNSMGIDSNKFITVREFNGKNILNTKSNYNEYLQKFNYIDFGNIKNLSRINPATYSNENTSVYPNNKFVLEVSDFTDQSDIFDENWSIEFFVKYNSSLKTLLDDQSLLRLERSSRRDGGEFPKNRPLINVKYSKTNKSITLDIEECENPANNINDFQRRSVVIENVDLFSGSSYYFCISRKIIQDEKIIYRFNVYESNYPYSNIKSYKKVEEFLKISDRNEFQEKTRNISGLFIGETNSNIIHSDGGLEKINTNFEGKLHSLKIWKKYITEKEINSHKADFRSFGLEKPLDLFERQDLVLDLNLRQQFKNRQDDEFIDQFDFSNDINFVTLENSAEKFNHVEGLATPVPENIMLSVKLKCDRRLGEVYDDLSEIMSSESLITKKTNIKIDEPVIFNGVNINYFDDTEYNALFGLNNEEERFSLDSNFEIDNDVRCSIDFSNVNFLNKEISNLISYNDFLNDELSKSFSKYDESYKNIDYLSEKFFGILSEEINFKPLYQIYKYFDNILSDLLYQTIPSRVNYLGFNFVYESHALERHKYNYKMSENRLPVVENHLNITSDEHIVISSSNEKSGLKYRNNNKTSVITTHNFQR